MDAPPAIAECFWSYKAPSSRLSPHPTPDASTRRRRQRDHSGGDCLRPQRLEERSILLVIVVNTLASGKTATQLPQSHSADSDPPWIPTAYSAALAILKR